MRGRTSTNPNSRQGKTGPNKLELIKARKLRYLVL